jgi:hypothetical protein
MVIWLTGHCKDGFGFDEFDVKSDQENSQYRSVEYGTDDVTSWIRFSNRVPTLAKEWLRQNKVKNFVALR